tara:strand:+ start:453 stop:659 length:207 start_codon:yes stop_codon:yes gene_type:complete
MTPEALHIIIIIAVSLTIGICVGFILTVLMVSEEAKKLNEELDKFRRLYFNEVDKWKKKYDNTDYEAY